jgi:hypothetical protein
LGGGKAESVAKAATELSLDSLVWAIVSVFIVGIGMMMGLMAMMKDLLNLSSNIILAAGALVFALVVAVEGVFIWQLLSRRSGAQAAGDVEQLQEQTTKELDAAQPRSLPEPLPSVTEHTTRSFEPLYSQRKSK